MTPLCAAVQGRYCRIVEMLLEHEDGDKYLRPNDEWETTIARAFDHWHISPALVILIETAMSSDRKFLLFTLQKVIEYGVDGFRGDPERLAALLKQFPSEERALAVGSFFVTMLIKIVNDNDEYGHLYNLLRIAPYFCSSERLRPYLLSALHLAHQRHYFDCEDSLRDTLDGTAVVH